MAYDIALLVHIFAAIAVFVGITLEWLVVLSMRRADSVAAIRTWVGYTAPLSPIYGILFVTLVATGLYMLHDGFANAQPWALATLVLMVGLIIAGALINGTSFDAIRHGLQEAPDGPIPAAMTDRIGDPALYTMMQVFTGLMLAVVMVMTLKPGWRDSLLTIAAWLVVAVGASLPAWRGRHAGTTSPLKAHR